MTSFMADRPLAGVTRLSTEWLAEQHAADQRRFLTLVAGSIVVHAAFLAALAIAPSRPRYAMPDVLRVDLVAGLPAAARPAAPSRPKPAPAARPKPKQVVLPKEAQAAIPKAPPKPRPAKPAARPDPIEYEDALSQLRAELGEKTPVAPQVEADVVTDAQAVAPGEEVGTVVDADATAWHRAVSGHLRSCWITPPEFLNRSLATGLEVRLTAAGAVLGEPLVTHRSGDPFFDENAVRAVMRCAPLPGPPAAGNWRFAFTSETR